MQLDCYVWRSLTQISWGWLQTKLKINLIFMYNSYTEALMKANMPELYLVQMITLDGLN